MSPDIEEPVDLTGLDVDHTLGLPGGERQLPPPGMTMEEVEQLRFAFRACSGGQPPAADESD